MSWIVLGEDKGKIKLVSKRPGQGELAGLLPKGSFLTIETDTNGMNVILPSNYPAEGVGINLNNVTVRGSFIGSGIILTGKDLSYDPAISIDSCDIMSNTSISYTGDEEIGNVVINITTENDASLKIKGEMLGSPGHGLLVVQWPFSEPLTILNSNIRDAKLDGIHSNVPLSIRVQATSIKDARGWGANFREGTNISMVSILGKSIIDSNRKGGLKLERTEYIIEPTRPSEQSRSGIG